VKGRHPIKVRKRVQRTRQEYHAYAYLHARRQRGKDTPATSWKSDSFAGLPELDFLVQSLQKYQPDRSTRVLDVGCGFGNLTIPLASLGYSVSGIDIQPGLIEKAKELNPFTQATFHCIDVEQLTGKVFDVIVLTQVLEHLVDPGRFLRVLASLCRPGGVLLLTLPNGYGPKELVERLYRRLRTSRVLRQLVLTYRERMRKSNKSAYVFDLYSEDNSEESPHAQQFTMCRLLRLLQNSGFGPIEIQHCDIFTTLIRFYLPFLPLPATVQRLDYWLADMLPHRLVSHWFLVCRRGEQSFECGDGASHRYWGGLLPSYCSLLGGFWLTRRWTSI
jgi:2-polyprenyl-3-methyl-5-hydroxy-6-metoxy-1,4-benzoquinol methylase